MKLLIHSFDNPAMNLAYEELLFDSFDEDILRLWISPPSVVVGKHQNALKECNLHFCLNAEIPVIRRISGGGTVYHDFGNINFSFFRSVQPDKMIDYDRNLSIISKAIEALGFPVEMNERHDLYLSNKKISGNAQHIKRGRSLHHGTILYDANWSSLRDAIKRESGHFTDKAVSSVRSQVMNLREYKDIGDTSEFMLQLIEVLTHQGQFDLIDNSISQTEVERLSASKYSNEDWNFGYSPAYEFENNWKGYHLSMKVARGGLIEHLEIKKKGSEDALNGLYLLGLQHHYSAIRAYILSNQTLSETQKELYLSLLF